MNAPLPPKNASIVFFLERSTLQLNNINRLLKAIVCLANKAQSAGHEFKFCSINISVVRSHPAQINGKITFALITFRVQHRVRVNI